MTYQRALDMLLDDYKLGNEDEQNMLLIVQPALEKQIPKKPYKKKGRLQNNYFCSACKYYLGAEKELEYAGLQPEYCQQCGQALDWSDYNDE